MTANVLEMRLGLRLTHKCERTEQESRHKGGELRAPTKLWNMSLEDYMDSHERTTECLAKNTSLAFGTRGSCHNMTFTDCSSNMP